MKTTPKSCFAAVAAAAVLLVAGTAPSAEERTESFKVSPGQKVVFELKSGGSIYVKSWDRSEAKVTYYDKYRGLDDYYIEIIAHNRDGLKIIADLERRRNESNSLQFELRVPRKFDVEFYSAGGGVGLIGVEGTFEGKTMGGSITLENVKGEASIITMGGKIRILDSEVDGEVHTMGGDVLVEDVVGNVRVTSNGGNVQYIKVRGHDGKTRGPGRLDTGADDVSDDTVLISSMGGSIDVDDAPKGAVVSTAGGRINVKNAARFVEAQTGGGNIEIRITDGWVKASTGAGDIEVVVEGSSSTNGDMTLITGTGDISLALPPGFSMELDVDLAYTRNSDQDYRIISNLEIDVEHTDKWDYSNGTPRKHIYGTAIIAGGRNKVKIRTVNGDVHIHTR